ncbi:hypothetical protein Rhopal_004910-T1 [Rhodotorula paludigena]|uniref:Zinc finger PHD-type domain-containing protein n=1 Tax=Rhodotorula paludigena TaxID=86838 RepID=A0AAV5GPS3_9BASI|nr:hypothetical protein Rhopal_004910-T1 [Rhodotorula paludigena]
MSDPVKPEGELATPAAAPPPPPSEQQIADGLKYLRQSFKVAAIAHWAVLFGHHVGFEFDTEAFELDLLGVKPDTQVPELLGKILNTLANDRNTKLNALRRSYNRRVTARTDNPFYSWHRVPASVVEAERELEREREDAEWEAKFGSRFPSEPADGAAAADGEQQHKDGPRAIWDDEERKLREAEKALYRMHGKHKAKVEAQLKAEQAEEAAAAAAEVASEVKAEPATMEIDPALLDPALATSTVPPTVDSKADEQKAAGDVVHEAGAADVNMAGSTVEAGVPVTEAALDDGFNAEMADVVAQDAAQGALADKVGAEDQAAEDEEEWYEEQRAVEWHDLSLETKLDAIYNVCEWHMVDPERQFRKYLHWDGEAAWRLDPHCVDAEGNRYFHTADDRLWVQRPPPPPSAEQPEGQAQIKRPRTLLGLKAGPRDKSKKGTVTGVMRVKLRKDPTTGTFEQVDEDDEGAPVASGSGVKVEDAPASDAVVKGEEGDEEPTAAAVEEEVELPEWEQKYWEERLRCETTPGFVEWEALCVTIDDWINFADEIEESDDPVLVKLGDHIRDTVVPAMQEEAKRREAAKAEELAALARKRSSRIVAKDSIADEEARIAAERASERASRASRHQIRSYADDGLGVGESGVGGSDSGTPGAAGESREERLRKREEEKRAREEAEERRLLEEAREIEREEARKANGGVLPVELMNDDERRAWEKQQEKERKKEEADRKKREKEDAKKARARERRAELKAEREAEALADAEAEADARHQAAAANEAAAAAQAAQAAAAAAAAASAQAADDPWWLDCEICQAAGWNYDDGQELLCCDECEEWQHLPCHVYADQVNGRAPQPYTDESFSFVCARCKGLEQRRPKPPVPPPGAIPTLTYPFVPYEPPAPSGKRKAANGRGAPPPAAKKPKAVKPKANGGSIPYGHGSHPLYHPSAYQHPNAVSTYSSASPSAPTPAPAPAAAPPAAAAAPAPAAQPQQSASMSYEDLKAAIEQNPALMAQLPAEYQQHFSQLLGLPLPG